MLLDLDLSGRHVLVIGPPDPATRVGRRYAAAGAQVTTCTEPTVPDLGQVALVVDARPAGELADARWSAVVDEVVRRHGAPVTRDTATPAAGTVTLVGGGPGSPELHTVAARRALAGADVVLTDRLATHDDRTLLARLAPAARIVDVGKQPGHHKIPQDQINAILVEEARAGHAVVRLKGGDPFVFGRGTEEIDAVTAAGLPVFVVPGITSAIAVPASIGIAVTEREISRSFTVVSGHHPLTDDLCTHLVGVGGTIVILMGMGTLIQSVSSLQRAGLDPSTPVAVVQEGYTATSRQVRARLDQVVDAVREAALRNPAVIVIGQVAAR